MFKDRLDAGKKLAEKLSQYSFENLSICALPRGGVILGVEIAKFFNVPCKVLICKKIPHPTNREVAIGATCGQEVTINPLFNNVTSSEYLKQVKIKVNKEIENRREIFKDYLLSDAQGKTILLVDDGIATGYSLIAACSHLKKLRAKKVLVAVPVSAPDSLQKVAQAADQVICLETPLDFHAVGQYYKNFNEVTFQQCLNALTDAS